MKRQLFIVLLAIVASLCLAFGIAGCSLLSGNSNDSNSGNNTEQTTSGEDNNSSSLDNTDDENSPDDETDDWITEGTTGLEYTLSDDGTYYTVTGIGTATDTDIVIPSEYEDLPVTAVGDGAFSDCTSLTSVTIGGGVSTIGKGAFYVCTSITNVTIGNDVTSIGNSAFAGCTSITEIYYNAIACEDLSENNLVFYKVGKEGDGIIVYVGANVTKLPAYLFSPMYTSLLPSLISSLIPPYLYAPNITSVVFAENSQCKSIGERTFAYCSSLKTVTIGKNVTFIGDCAFEDCTSLTGVYITDLAAWCKISFYCEYANPIYYAGNLYLNGELETKLVIPDSVTSINVGAFYGCTSITSVTIGNGVTSIGDGAFFGCTSITSVTIPDSVTKIGNYAFCECTSLISVTIPNSVTEIGDYAFCECTSLTSVTIPNSVTSIGEEAFSGCTSITSVTIGNGVTSIGSGAFYACTSLISVTIPDSVTKIGNYAFEECASLTSVTFKNTEGWWYYSSLNISGTSISSDDLSDPATAAKYLTDTYYNYYWYRTTN